jgi:hypothetical protein
MVYAGLDNPDSGAASASGERRGRSVRDIGVVLFEGFSLLTTGAIPEVFQGGKRDLRCMIELGHTPATYETPSALTLRLL